MNKIRETARILLLQRLASLIEYEENIIFVCIYIDFYKKLKNSLQLMK